MKGEAVVQMLETYLGSDRWRQTVRSYVRWHQHGNTSSQSLWDELGHVAGPDAVQVAHDFTLQPGVPLLTVTDECLGGRTRLALTQGEWVRDRPGKTALTWHVPVLAAHPGMLPVSGMVAGEGVMNLAGCGPVIVNAGHHGYYRTLYTPSGQAFSPAIMRRGVVTKLKRPRILSLVWSSVAPLSLALIRD